MGMTQDGMRGISKPQFIDVQRRAIVSRTVSDNEVETLSIEKLSQGQEPKRLLLLNKFDAQQLKDVLDEYLKTIYSKELSGLNTTLSPKDMMELFGDDVD